MEVVNQAGLRRIWVAGAFVLGWALVFTYGALQLLAAPRGFFPVPEPPPSFTKPRGRILTADGQVLAISPHHGERRYPLGTLAGQIVGYTERARDRYGRGLAGIEGLRNLTLARGEDVWLTLDSRIQALAEAALAHGMERAKARWGAVVVLGRDGRVLAAANAPFFDPQSPRGNPDEDPRLANYAFRYLIEPGSTVKALTAAVLLEEGAVQARERIPVPAERKVADRRVHDWRWHPTEEWTLEEILAHSSNVGISLLAERIPKATLHRYFEKLHLADGRILAGLVARPLFPSLERWGPVEYANATFGQGFAVTPLHLAAAMNALADGRFQRPRIFANDPALSVRVFSESTAREVRAMLERRLARRARLPGYRLAGKTGTAQIATRGGYDPERVVALFAGFIPADRPRATAVVVLYDPQVPPKERYGSKLAAPVFRELAAGLLSLWGEPPARAKLDVR